MMSGDPFNLTNLLTMTHDLLDNYDWADLGFIRTPEGLIINPFEDRVIGRITKSGREDRRFTRTGKFSLFNGPTKQFGTGSRVGSTVYSELNKLHFSQYEPLWPAREKAWLAIRSASMDYRVIKQELDALLELKKEFDEVTFNARLEQIKTRADKVVRRHHVQVITDVHLINVKFNIKPTKDVPTDSVLNNIHLEPIPIPNTSVGLVQLVHQ